MKKLKTYSLVVITTLSLFTSCSKDDDASGNDTEPVAIEGTWKLKSLNTTTPLDLNSDGVTEADLVKETGCYTNETVVFNVDKTGMIKSTSYADIVASIEIGTTDSYTYSAECVNEVDNTSFTWAKNGNIITVVEEEGTYTLTLNSNNELILTIEDTFSVEDPDNNGDTVVSDEDITMIYTKQ